MSMMSVSAPKDKHMRNKDNILLILMYLTYSEGSLFQIEHNVSCLLILALMLSEQQTLWYISE